MERYRVMEWLNFIATEIHKQFGPLWYPDTPDATSDKQRATLAKRFDYVSKTLSVQPYLTGDAFAIADAYLFTVAELGGYAQGRPVAVAGIAEIPGAGRRASASACDAGGRRPGQGGAGSRLTDS